jgi:catechol 2,3-dioxygenase-like lactoylglutathione lyase family enzyme
MNEKLKILENGIPQIGFVVKNLEEMVEKYWKVFGIGPWDFYTYEKPFVTKMSYMGRDADYSMRVALSYLGSTRIELIEIKEGNSIYKDFVEKKGYGVQHLGILVNDIQAVIRQAESIGIRMIQDGMGFGLDGDGHFAYLDTEDDFGIVYELIERPKGRKKPEKTYPPEVKANS